MSVRIEGAAPLYACDGESMYEQEMAALQQDFAEMNRDMAVALREAETRAAQACSRIKESWEGKIEAERGKLSELASQCRSEEERALGQHEADALALEALRTRDIERLRREMPRPDRPHPPPPPRRPHRSAITRMCVRPEDEASRRQARCVSARMQACGHAAEPATEPTRGREPEVSAAAAGSGFVSYLSRLFTPHLFNWLKGWL